MKDALSTGLEDVFYAVNEYGVYCIPETYRHRTVPQLLMKGEVYERKTLGFIRQMCGTGDVIAGGAFVGDFLPAISAALGPRAQLHTFEPAPITRAACQETLRLNNLKNVKLHPVAVGAETASLPLRVATETGEAAAAKACLTDAESDLTVTVDVVPLDDLVAKTRKVSILQLDVEGHEAEALRGAARIIGDHTPIIILEAEKRPIVQGFLAQLRADHPGAGYKVIGRMERNAMFMPGFTD